MSNEIWVYCETAAQGLHPVGLELLGEAARLKGTGCVTAVVLGSGIAEAAKTLIAYGADRVLLMDDPALAIAEEMRYAEELAHLARREQPDILLLGATAFGRVLAPRLAAELETGLTADCTALGIQAETGMLLQTRPAFGGNLMATILCPEKRPQMATVRPRVFRAAEPDWSRRGEIERPLPSAPDSVVQVIEEISSGEDSAIADAKVLVAIGAGIGSDENIALAKKLTQRLGGALAASRALVDAGRAPYAAQVGQTGKTVAPRLYIALGISGAVQHMAGVAAQTVVAVNTDTDAPIFSQAHYALICDCGDFLRETLAQLGE